VIDDVKKRWTSRKLILCMLAASMAFAALLLDQIGETTFRDLILGTIGVYVAGNVGQKFVTKETPT
jgi:hypothetical protein